MMDRPPPPLNFIRSFECAARHLSFTKAAIELGYTQAAISTHIRALEKYINRSLFVRNARSIELTEMGKAFLPTLRHALHQIDSATDAIATTSKDRSVVISCPMSLAENWLPGCLSAFRASYPDVDITINATIWDNPENNIADIVISVNRNDEVPLGARKLWDETLSLLCAPAIAQEITWATDVAVAPKILVAGRQEYWTILADALGVGSLDLESAIKTNASNVSLELAAHGLGTTIAPTSLCATYTDRGLLLEPLAIRPVSPWSYYILRCGGRRNLVANDLFEWLSSYCRSPIRGA